MRANVGSRFRQWQARCGWRERLLLDAGFHPVFARLAAQDSRFDVHALIELTERGCPPHLAARILAPLEDEPAA